MSTDSGEPTERWMALANFASWLSSGPATAEDLTVAIAALRDSIQLAQDKAPVLSNLAKVLEDRYRLTGAAHDLDEAVDVMRRAVALRAPAIDASYQSNLSGALQLRYLRAGKPDDLKEAVAAARLACATAPGTAGFLHNLGGALHLEYVKERQAEVLGEALAVQREALRLATAGTAGRAEMLSQLGILLRASYDAGKDDDLEQSIAFQRQAIEETPAADKIGQAIRLSCLATAISRRYERTAERADLDAYMTLSEQAVKACPARYPKLGMFLTNFGGALRALYERTHDPADLTQAVDMIAMAFGVSRAEDPDIYMYGTNMGSVLVLKYRDTGDATALDSAIGVLQIVVDDTEPGPDRHMLAAASSILGTAFATRYDHGGAPADIEAAEKALLRAIQLTPDDDPRHVSYCASLATMFRSHALRTGDATVRAAALSALESAAADPALPTRNRIGCAEVAASMRAEAGQWAQAAQLLAEAVRLLPLTAPRELRHTDQQSWLARFPDLAADAAACAIEVDDHEGAVTSLELGRGILIGQALQLRDAVAELGRTDPDLAGWFEQARAALDAPVPELPHLRSDSPGDALAAFDRDRDLSVQRRKLVAELEQATAEIRARPGFGGFMAAPSVAELRRAATPGPIVFLNVSRYRSDALIVTADGIRPPVRLDLVTPGTVAGQVADLMSAVEAASNAATFRPAQETLSQVLQWLWETTAAPVLTELGYARKPAAEQPSIWWAPTGLLSYLPVHAAGQGGSGALDRVISSYTPTAYALVESRKREPAPGESQTMLVIAMPQTAGRPDLKGAANEATMLAARFPGLEIFGTWPEATAAATRDSVLTALPRHALAHFACHGECDMADPARSSLLVSDHERTPLTIADIAALNLGHAQLAYLSACETAQTSLRLTNEAQHLVTAFGLAGYPHVIGTLWKVSDSAAFSIAKQVYAKLGPAEGPLRAGLAAAALHAAIHELRDWYPDDPTLWAAHIHVGA